AMNAMVGDPGPAANGSVNTNNPGYVQFFKLSQVPQPAEIFVFLDEHPDTLDDGYFIANDTLIGSGYTWSDLPASYHNRAAAFSFADGHGALHRWQMPETVKPPAPNAVSPPMRISASRFTDLEWVTDHMSIDRN
ncbi:MAG TPA: prepilin-type cleavage/methylation domain-containing protein, partial [Verrucomicrobiae bacterium]|nr:prepilin-type cleavage/methylation domain-containing protein [Verrucomicrobiae bacterium]